MTAPGSLQGLRSANVAAVLQVAALRGGVSRAEIARRTGLGRTTVSTVVGELLAGGALVELERRPAGRRGGRPATVVSVDPRAGTAVGVHLAHDVVRVVVADLAGRLVGRREHRLDVDTHPTETLRFAGGAARDLLAAGLAAGAGAVVGVGVAMSAPVRVDAHGRPSAGRFGGADGPHLLPRWRDVDVARLLGRDLGVAVAVDNDANLGALAEWTWGAGRGADHLLYVMLSDGVGGGLVLDGRVYRGAGGAAGELGHVVVVPEGGAVCRCGSRGCLETVAGGPALARALPGDGAPPSPADVVARVRAGDVGARRVVADAGRATGRALAGLCTVLDPGCVVLGGELAGAGDVLTAAVREELVRHRPPAATGAVRLTRGELGADAEVRGAVALALQRAGDQRAVLGVPAT